MIVGRLYAEKTQNILDIEIYSGMQVDANQTIKTDVINANWRRQREGQVIFSAKDYCLKFLYC